MEASHEAQLSGKEQQYLTVVRSLNEANLARQPYNAIAEFATAAAKEASGTSPHSIKYTRSHLCACAANSDKQAQPHPLKAIRGIAALNHQRAPKQASFL